MVGMPEAQVLVERPEADAGDRSDCGGSGRDGCWQLLPFLEQSQSGLNAALSLFRAFLVIFIWIADFLHRFASLLDRQITSLPDDGPCPAVSRLLLLDGRATSVAPHRAVGPDSARQNGWPRTPRLSPLSIPSPGLVSGSAPAPQLRESARATRPVENRAHPPAPPSRKKNEAIPNRLHRPLGNHTS